MKTKPIIEAAACDPAAQSTGRKAAGVPKRYTPDELAKRKARLAEARKSRWPVKKEKK